MRLAGRTLAFALLVLVDLYGTLEVLTLWFVHRKIYANLGDTAAFWIAFALVIVVYVLLVRYTIRFGRRLRASFASRFARPS